MGEAMNLHLKPPLDEQKLINFLHILYDFCNTENIKGVKNLITYLKTVAKELNEYSREHEANSISLVLSMYTHDLEIQRRLRIIRD